MADRLGKVVIHACTQTCFGIALHRVRCHRNDRCAFKDAFLCADRLGRGEAIHLSGREPQPSAAIFDGRTVQSTSSSGGRVGYDGHKRCKGSKTHLAEDTLGLLVAVHVTPANEQERAQVVTLAAV